MAFFARFEFESAMATTEEVENGIFKPKSILAGSSLSGMVQSQEF